MPSLSFVIPVYNERGTIEALVSQIQEQTDGALREILLIDDGSTDGSGAVMDELVERYAPVEVIRFARNCGKTEALKEGFAQARGDVVFTLDGDLQDDPKEIPRMVGKLLEGYDLVCGWKKFRQDPWHKTLPSKVYNRLIGRLFGLDLHDMNTGYKAMRREVAQSLELRDDFHRFIPILAAHSGFRVTEIPVEHHPRQYGESKYGMSRFFTAPFDIWTLWRILRKR